MSGTPNNDSSSQPTKPQSFILEPILTPSGIVDGLGDDAPDVDDVDLLPDELPEVESVELEDVAIDLDDIEILEFHSPEPDYTAGVFTVGNSGEVSIDYLFDGGMYEGEVGIFSLDGLEAEPGSEEFIKEAARRALSSSDLGHVVISDATEGARFSGNPTGEGDFNVGEHQGVKTVQMRAGDRFGMILTPNHSIEDVYSGQETEALFSLATANPNDDLQFGQIADVTGDGNTFAFEDLSLTDGSDRDYNDIVLHVQGATGDAPSMDELVNEWLDWRDSEVGQELVDFASQAGRPEIEQDLSDFTLDASQSSQTLDLDNFFNSPTGEDLVYTVQNSNHGAVTVDLAASQLTLTVQDQTGMSEIQVVATTPDGKSITQSFTVVANPLDAGTTETIRSAVNDFANNVDALTNATDNATVDAALDQIDALLDEQPELLEVLTDPDALQRLGLDAETTAQLDSLLADPEIGEALGLDGSLQDAIANPGALEKILINYQEAMDLLPDEPSQPTVAFLDFAGQHSEDVTGVFAGINPTADYEAIAIDSGNWAAQLVDYIEQLEATDADRQIVNLSFDLTQTDAEGRITTRYELTPAEQTALQQAQEKGVLLVVAAGNTGDRISALGSAAQTYDNIITVGAVNPWEEVADYSGRGESLTLVAPGGEWRDNPDAFVGTSKATAYATGAASLVWAANPELNYQQVKDILINSAMDIGPEGWDADSGSGILDLATAVAMAQGTTARSLPIDPVEYAEIVPFSGKGRVTPNERAASDNTEAAIAALNTTQSRLVDEWTVLWLQGNPELNLDDLKTQVLTQSAAALTDYQQVNTEAAQSLATSEQRSTALDLATRHHQIENNRLQALLTRQADLTNLLAELNQQRATQDQTNADKLAQLDANIVQIEQELAAAIAKLDYLFVDPQTLLGEPDLLNQQAADQTQLAQTYRQQANTYRSTQEHHTAQAEHHDAQSQTWGITGTSRSRSGRKRTQWGWIADTEQVKLRDQHRWQAQLAEQNATVLEELATQLETQAEKLTNHAQLIAASNINFNQSQGNEDDAAAILTQLQSQAEAQAAIADSYWQQAELAEKRRQQNQERADWHTDQSRRREVVRVKKKRCGSDQKIYGWVDYPEHLPLAEQAQQAADLAAQETAQFQDLAHQAQLEANELQLQAERLDLLVNEDWDKLKRAIEIEIAAQQHRLQSQQDLQILTTAQYQQAIANLDLQIVQTQTELNGLSSDRLPGQTQKTNATQARLEQARSAWETAQDGLATAQADLQQFLDTAGHFLPEQERLSRVNQTLEELSLEKARVDGAIAHLAAQVTENPAATASLEQAQAYQAALERDLQWVQVQQESLSLASPDSPEQLALQALIDELTARQAANPSTNSLPLDDYLNLLQQIRDRSTNLLTGFDDLGDRLNEAQTEQAQINTILERLQAEYRDLGLVQGSVDDLSFVPELVAPLEAEIDAQQEIIDDYDAAVDARVDQIIALQQQKQAHEAKAAALEQEINQWEVIRPGSKFRSPVYGWVYHPEIEAQRDQELAAAVATQQAIDNATLDLQIWDDTTRPYVDQSYEAIALLEQKVETFNAAQANSESLNTQIATQENAISETLVAIAQTQTPSQLDQLNRQLEEQEQTRDFLVELRTEQHQRLTPIAAQLSDKYREIELTEQYQRQVNAEADRLQNRLDLIQQADALESQFQTEQAEWQNAATDQSDAIAALLNTRNQGASDRAALLALESQLNTAQTQLTGLKTQEAQLVQTLQPAQEALAFTELQLVNQELLLQSLNDQDAPLQSAEAAFYNLAEEQKAKIWYWDGKAWAYDSAAAEGYREALQNASLMADRRNELWPAIQETQTRVTELQTQQADQAAQVQDIETQIAAIAPQLPPLEAEIARVNTEIAPIAARLAPLRAQEQAQTQTFQTAATTAQTLASDLEQTMGEQVQALRRLISFGVLASESDVDFFFLDVEPKVLGFLDQLGQRRQDFEQQGVELQQLVADWQQELIHTTDPVSIAALTAQIAQTDAQVTQLNTWMSETDAAIAQLTDYLNQATTALEPLRLEQELHIREAIASNEQRLQALNAQLQSETAAETALADDTVLGYANLRDRVRDDLETVATIWTEDLQTGQAQTLALGESQANLSQAVDGLIANIETNFADPHGDYHQTATNLREAIATLDVLAPREDLLKQAVLDNQNAIAQIQQQVQKDAELWQTIAPIAARYGAESAELAAFEQQYQVHKDADQAIADQYELERQYHQGQANYWEPQRSRSESYRGRSGKKKTRWIHNPTADAKYQEAVTLAAEAAAQRDEYLEFPTAETYRDEFLAGNGLANPAAIGQLKQDTEAGRNEFQPLYEAVKAKISEQEAAVVATLAQADWYEQQAALHKARSEELGPDKQQATWTEQRRVTYRGKSGKKKRKWVTITHVNHDWIVWDNYTKLAAELRQQAADTLGQIAADQREKERWEPLATNWTDADNAVAQAEPMLAEARNLLAQLEAAHTTIPAAQAQQTQLEQLLATLEQQLAQATQEADAANTKALNEWVGYDADAAAYRTAITATLEQRGIVDTQALTVQQELADAERWVEQQAVALDEEQRSLADLQADLAAQEGAIAAQLPTATGTNLSDLQAKQNQLQATQQLLTNKATVLTHQQTALTQKRTLLAAQNEVIVAEQRLLDAYLESPDADFSALQAQLQSARDALAEAQRLAEQAATNSQEITDPLQQTQADLLAQNDAHLQAAKAEQAVLKDLLEATQLNANYTLEAFEKQQALNDLEFEVLQRLQEATIAGSSEAQHLLDVAQYTSMAAAAEIYYRDYSDLASDNGSRCAGGLARPEDRQLADKYYREWLEHQEMQRRAQTQADTFTQAREAAEAQITTLQEQQTAAAERLNELNAQIATTEEEIATKEQELAVIRARMAGLEDIREQTEQTFIQLLTLEELNLSQARLEQEFAQVRQAEIDEAVAARLERDRLEVERHRLETQAKIEQLRQLQTEDDLRQALNQVRADVGLAEVQGSVDSAQVQGQLAALLGSLQTLSTQQPNLPANLQALLTETQADLYLALQGDESQQIEANLLAVAEGLIEQINQYKGAIAQLDLEEQQDEALLAQAEQDIQAATLQLLQEVQQAQALGGEREILSPLNLEILQRVAYAEQAVEISGELAQQSKDLLSQIIDQRKEERKARKKAFWNETLGTIVLVLDILSLVFNFIPGFQLVSKIMSIASGVIQGIIAGINGNWALAFRQLAMSILNTLTLTNSANSQSIFGFGDGTLKFLNNSKTLVEVAYQAYEASEAGDDITAFLYIVKGIADVAGEYVDIKTANYATKMLLSLGQESLDIYKGIQAGEKVLDDISDFGAWKDLYDGSMAIFNSFKDPLKAKLDDLDDSQEQDKSSKPTETLNRANEVAKDITFGDAWDDIWDRDGDFDQIKGYGKQLGEYLEDKWQGWTGLDFEETGEYAKEYYGYGKNAHKTYKIIQDSYDSDDVDVWLTDIKDILGVWNDDIQGLTFGSDIIKLAKEKKISPHQIQRDPITQEYFYWDNEKKENITLKL